MSAPPVLLWEVDGPLGILTLNRPARRNALSRELMKALEDRFASLAQDHTVRAVILAGAGAAFCAGHDLSEMAGHTAAEYRELFDECVRVMQLIQSVPQPVIAAVHGIATAAGCQLAATCDLVVASESATFACPGVKIGLFCSTPMVPLTRTIGPKRAMEMLLTGRAIDAPTALDWGLANHVVPVADLMPAARALGLRVAEASSFTIGLGKAAFYAQIDLDQARAYAYAKEVMTLNALAPDAQEGIGAFLEKRVPCWPSPTRS